MANLVDSSLPPRDDQLGDETFLKHLIDDLEYSHKLYKERARAATPSHSPSRVRTAVEFNQELENARLEKQRLNEKLEEFSKALQSFQ